MSNVTHVICSRTCIECGGRRSPEGRPLETCPFCKGTGRQEASLTLADFAALFVPGTVVSLNDAGDIVERNALMVRT